MDRRYGPPNRRGYIDDGEYTEQVIIQEPPKKWFNDVNWVALLYPVIGVIFGWVFHVNERVTALEYKQLTLIERHAEHIKTDDEFKNLINQLDKKVDGIQEHIRSVEETMMEMYRGMNTRSNSNRLR
jgi:hypothetical protein